MGLTEYLIIGIIALLVVVFVAYFVLKRKTPRSDTQTTIEINKENIEALAEYVKAQKEQAEEKQRLDSLRRAEQKQKLEAFKQTKDVLKDRLKTQFDQKEWRPLSQILKSADKGVVGIYIIYNETKNKYYVGQAKQIIQRVKKHFQVEDMARDFLDGDRMNIKFLTANELGNDYRLDHVEKTGIEIFEADKNGYNKTTGNL